MSLAVDMDKKKVSLILSDQTRLEGFLFLSPYSELGVGKQTILEYLSSDDPFLPFETADGEFSFIHQRRIVLVTCPVEVPEEPVQAAAAGAESLPVETRRVAIHLMDGQHITGLVEIDMPEGKNRLSDWLNRTRKFMVLKDDYGDILVNLKFIVRVSVVAGH